MKTTLSFGDITRQLAVSLRLLPITVVICSGLYTVIILLAGQVVPYSSSGSLIRSEKGEVVGSDLIGQQFKQPKYFWPRPSAVSWNAASAGASNHFTSIIGNATENRKTASSICTEERGENSC